MKRYPKYKDSGIQWLGQIPEHWETRKIAELFTERREKVSDKDFPALSVSKAGITPQLETAVKTDNGDNRKKVCEGDFVVNSRSDRKGSCGVSPYTGSVSLINTVLQPRTELNRSYMHYLLRSNDYIEEYYRLGRGIVADLWTTRYSEAKNIYIPFPPIAEQEKIVAFIDAKTNQIDAFIAEREKQSQALSELRQTIIAEAVTRGLNPDVTKRDSGVSWIGEIPAHWNVCRLSKIAKLKTGGTPKFYMSEINGDTIDWYTPSDFTEDFELKSSNRKLNKSEFEKAGIQLFPSYSILIIGIGGTAGKVAYNNTPCYSNQQITAIIPTDSLDTIYGTMYFRTLREFLLKTAPYTTLPILNNTYLAGLNIAVPPIEEQRAIVEYIDSKCKHINDTIAQIESEITHLKEYKQRLIADAVTGAINVQE